MMKSLAVEEICQNYIGDFLQNIDVSEISFPIMNPTYSLWRKIAYNQVMKGISKQSEKAEAESKFNQTSEGRLLPKFIQKLTQNIRIASEGYKKLVHQSELKEFSNEEEYEMMFGYGSLIWRQQLYLELIEDLARLPYLRTFTEQSHLHVKEEYLTVFSKRQQTTVQKIGQNIGKKVAMKGFTTAVDKLIKNKALSQINMIVGGFNPLMFALTYGFSTSLEAFSKHVDHSNMITDLKKTKQVTENKVNKLEETYCSCLELIRIIVNHQSKEGEQFEKFNRKLKKMFFVIFQEEWLNIEIQEDGEWEIVKIQEKENFQTLDINSSTGLTEF